MEKQLKFHWPILGHGQIKKYLQSCILNKTLAHAYLFNGPHQVGKFLTAQYLAGSTMCSSSSEKRPCHQCNSCLQLAKNIHTDVTIIEKEKDKDNITINQIRELQHKLSLRSFLTDYKVAIINGAEEMTEEAMNALLKTLEEPTAKTIFILITQTKELLPLTIVSRCQSLTFKIIPSYQIENWLISRGENKEKVKLVARLANGRPGLANILLADNSLLEQRLDKINYLLEIISADLHRRFKIINNIVDYYIHKEDARQLLDSWISLFRDIILVNNHSSSYIINHPFKEKVGVLTKKYPDTTLIKIIDEISQSKEILSKSIKPQLVLENLALTI